MLFEESFMDGALKVKPTAVLKKKHVDVIFEKKPHHGNPGLLRKLYKIGAIDYEKGIFDFAVDKDSFGMQCGPEIFLGKFVRYSSVLRDGRGSWFDAYLVNYQYVPRDVERGLIDRMNPLHYVSLPRRGWITQSRGRLIGPFAPDKHTIDSLCYCYDFYGFDPKEVLDLGPYTLCQWKDFARWFG